MSSAYVMSLTSGGLGMSDMYMLKSAGVKCTSLKSAGVKKPP